MSKLTVSCPGCSAAFAVSVKMAGRRAKCPKCASTIEIPEAEPTPVPESNEIEWEEPESAAVEPAADEEIVPAQPAPSAARVPLALAAAAGAAVLGAAVWAAISYFTGYEVGYVAWGIGGLVGFAALLLGGRGIGVAVACAVLALASIAGGKYLAAKFIIDKYMTGPEFAQQFRESFDEHKADAEAFAKLVPKEASDDVLRDFMADHGFAEKVESITADDVTDFKENVVPGLREFAANPPEFEAWSKERMTEAQLQIGSNDVLQVAKEMLGPIDLLFAALGIATAFGIIMKVTSEEAAAVRAANRSRRTGSAGRSTRAGRR